MSFPFQAEEIHIFIFHRWERKVFPENSRNISGI